MDVSCLCRTAWLLLNALQEFHPCPLGLSKNYLLKVNIFALKVRIIYLSSSFLCLSITSQEMDYTRAGFSLVFISYIIFFVICLIAFILNIKSMMYIVVIVKENTRIVAMGDNLNWFAK